MEKKSNRLANNMMYYFIGTFSTKVLQFAFLPLYTIYLSASEFGYFDLINTSLIVLLPIFFQAIWEGVLRFGIEIEEEKERDNLFSTVIIYSFLLTVVYSVIFIIVFPEINTVLILLMASGQMFLHIWNASARALQMNHLYAFGNIVYVIISLSTNITLIVYFKMGVESLFIANFLSSYITVVFIELKLKLFKKIKFSNFDQKMLKLIFRYSAPLMISSSSWHLLNLSSRLLIPFLIGMKENGIFAIASRFPSIIAMLTSVYTLAWQEEMMREANNKSNDKVFNLAFNRLMNFSFSILYILLPITLFMYPLLVHGDFYESINYLPILYLSTIVSTFASHMAAVFLMKKNTVNILINTVSSAIVTIFFMVILSIPFQLYGVAISILLGSIYRFVLCIILAKRVINVKINWKNLSGYLVLYSIFTYVFHTNEITFNIISLIIGGFLFLSFNNWIFKFIVTRIKGTLENRR